MAQGKRISTLQVMDIVTGERTVLKEFDSNIEAPNWTMDGQALIYNAGGSLYRFDLKTKESERIDTGICTRCNNDHVLSKDGKGLAISAGTDEVRASRVWVLPITGGQPRLMTELMPSYLHGWSPDGQTLAYCAERGGNFDVYTMPITGGEETRLTDAPGLDDGPEYAPDGKTIWFNSVRSGLMQVWRMNADGSRQTQMTCDGFNNWFPHVSPDGEKVAFVSYYKDEVAPGDHPADKNIKIRLMQSSGGPITTLLDAFGGQGTMNVNSWAPDSRRFAFVTYRFEA